MMNRQQIEWTYNHIERLTVEYLKVFPFNEKTWESLTDETRKIAADSKDNPDVIKLLLVMLDYFDNLDKEYRRLSK